MAVKLLTEHHLEFQQVSLKGGCICSSKSTHCWKSHVTAHLWKRVNPHWQADQDFFRSPAVADAEGGQELRLNSYELVCEKEISNMGKHNENLDLVCEKTTVPEQRLTSTLRH